MKNKPRLLDKVELKLKHYNLLFSIVYTILIAIVVWQLHLIHWESTDDFTISQLLMGTAGEASPYVQVCSYFFGLLVVTLQKTWPICNWYTVMEIGSVVVFFTITEWFIIKHSNKTLFTVWLLFPLIFEPNFLMNLQYTRSSLLLSFAGVVLVFDALVGYMPSIRYETALNRYNIRKIKCIFELLCGAGLFVLGSLFRYASIYISICYGLILPAICFMDYLIKNRNKSLLHRLVLFLFAVVLIASSCWISNYINTKIYEKWDSTNDFRAFNLARSSVSDYLPSSYTDELKEAGISENDWYMMKCGVINDNVFSKEYFEKVRAATNEIENDAKGVGEYNIKQVFYYRQGYNSGCRTQFVVAVICCLLSLLLSSGIYRIAVLTNIGGTVSFIVYFLYKNRLPPWVLDPIFLLASVIALICICCSNQTGRNTINAIKKIICIIGLSSCLVMNVLEGYEFFERNSYDPDVCAVISYAEGMKNEVFLLDAGNNCPYPYMDSLGDGTYFTEGQWSNIIRVGNWDIEHPTRNRQKALLGIDSVLYSMVDGQTKLIAYSDNNFFDVYKAFFWEHYGISVDFVCIEEFGGYGIYQAVLI